MFCIVEDTDDNSVEDEKELSPFITAWEASGQSRLTNEFDVLKSLGKGGFGDVIKVIKSDLYNVSYLMHHSKWNMKRILIFNADSSKIHMKLIMQK